MTVLDGGLLFWGHPAAKKDTNSTYVDGSLRLDEPSTEHRLDLAAAQLSVHLMNAMFHLFFQQKSPQTPVEKAPARPPTQYVLP